MIDDKLEWHNHIQKLTKKIASGIGALKRIRHLIPASTLHLIYQALIKPHFDYCDNVWGNCGKTLRDKLQKLQNRTARVLTFSGMASGLRLEGREYINMAVGQIFSCQVVCGTF